MSGLLGTLGGLFGSQGSGGPAGVAGLLTQVINAAGGPAGILQKFEQAGLGDKVQSWISQGHNLPVSAEQITRVFPPAQLDAWAQQHGLPAGAASQLLAQFLPHAVDHATPDGVAPATPQGNASGLDFTSLIGRLTGGK